MNCPSETLAIPSRLPNSLRKLCEIANLHYPDEPSPISGFVGETVRMTENEFVQRAKNATKSIWPELWKDEDWRALEVLRVMRDFLRRFWEAEDAHAQNWHIFRAREYYQRFMLRRELRPQQSHATNAEALLQLSFDIERKLDEPPARNLVENALFKLQERARKRSLAPRICENRARPLPPGIADDEIRLIQMGLLCPILDFRSELDKINREACPHPYFLRTKKRRKYCSRECAHEGELRSDLESWRAHKHQWRPAKRTRRKNEASS